MSAAPALLVVAGLAAIPRRWRSRRGRRDDASRRLAGEDRRP